MCASDRQKIAGVIGDDGSMFCTCGKKLGKATETAVEFYCRDCKADVAFDSQILLLHNAKKAIETVYFGFQTLTQLTTLMQSMQNAGQIAAPLPANGASS